MVENIVITKQGNESSDQNRTIFESTTAWSPSGSNLIVYKNGVLQEQIINYSIIDEISIQLSSSASVSDRISMVITKFIDPSGFTDLDQRVIDLDRASKKIANKTQTSIKKREFEETIPSSFIIHSDEIWASEIDPNPSVAETAGVAFRRFNFILTEDFTVANHKGWFASTNGLESGRIINWIPPKFGKLYHARIYDSTGSEIPSSSSINWKWDYQAGYLFIADDHAHTIPFKISAFVYTGSLGTDNLMHWKPPVLSFAVLPTVGNADGDIRFVTSDNKFYSWNDSETEWQSIEYGSSKFKDPVIEEISLPTADNTDGDIRLSLDNNTLYRWNAALSTWQAITGVGTPGSNYYTKIEVDDLLDDKADSAHVHDTIYYRKLEVDMKVRWRPSRDTETSLPPYTENIDGDVILTRDNNTIWRWYTSNPNTGQGYWAPILTSNYWWLSPVELVGELPTVGNQTGHVRLVKSEGIAYYWDGTEWLQLTANADNHEHDDRYYIKDEIYWLMPVANYATLPAVDNKEGDVRLTIDNNNTYRWDSTETEWILFSASVNWREHIDYISNLPITDNRDRDIRFVDEAENFYYWDIVSSTWKVLQVGDHNHDDRYYTETELDAGQLDDRYYTETEINERFDISTGHDHDGVDSKQIDYNNLLNIPHFYWKSPVVFLVDLPSTGNTVGDARIVLDERNIYVWEGADWQLVSEGTFQVHDHDDRYYTETEIDNTITALINQFNIQLALKSDINHIHDDRYYREDEIDEMFDSASGHDHDGVDSKQINYDDLTNVPDFTHDHDERYYTETELQTSGQAQVHWDNVTNVPPFGAFKTPVQAVIDLPATGNNVNDIRLVLDDSDLYEWDGTQWVFVGHWELPGPDFWESPVSTRTSLPTSSNQEGDVRLVLDENILYRWDSSSSVWVDLCCGDGSNDDLIGGSLQIYLNGLNLKPVEEWGFSNNQVVLVDPTQLGDTVTIVLIVGGLVKTYNFYAVTGQTVFSLGSTYYREDLVATQGQTLVTFGATYTPNLNELMVFLNGAIQRSSIDYTEPSNNSILFLNPLEENDRIIIIILDYHLGEGIYLREDHVSVQGQTSYTTLNAYTPGNSYLFVYLNGMLQRVSLDYAETSPHSVEFYEPNDAEDLVTFIILEVTDGPGGCNCNACQINLGIPTDGSWTDGLLPFNEDYKVCDALDDINEVLLEIAPEPPSSILNQELVSENLNFFSGYVSAGNINYEIAAGDYHNYLTEDSNFYLFTPDNSFSGADQGILKLLVNGTEIDSFDLYNAFNPSNDSGTQGTSYGILASGARGNEGVAGIGGALRNSTAGYISIIEVGAYGNFTLWQKGRARANIASAILRQGYNFIQFIHEINAETRASLIVKLFYDTSGSRPSLDTPVIVSSTINSTKYVSGVRYYSIGDDFITDFIASGIFSNTYIEYPIQLDMPGLSPLEIEYNHPDVSGVSIEPDVTDTFSMNTHFILNEWNEYSIDAVLEITPLDPFGTGVVSSSIFQNILVNTYSNGSTDLIEYFRDEVYRLPQGNYDVAPSPRVGNWNSQSLLNNDDALLFDKKLKYANIDFTSGYKPAPQTADYSAFSGPQTYYRSFYKVTAKNSGKLILAGITLNDLETNKIIIDIKLPTVSGWLSLNVPYDETTFDGVDSDGCFLNVDNAEEFNYSTGTLSTANSEYIIVVRITLTSAITPELEYIEMVWN